MRIIAGSFKARRIQAPKNLPVRPTTDMAKEALFNILNNHFYFAEIDVLDLFSGTGNITYEFLSRGTINVTAVDSFYGCIKFIEKTAEEFERSVQTIKSDVFQYLEKTSQKFDVIFADPPYEFQLEKFQNIAELVFKNNLLNEGGLLIIEHSNRTDLSNSNHFSYSKKYGSNMFSFFENS